MRGREGRSVYHRRCYAITCMHPFSRLLGKYGHGGTCLCQPFRIRFRATLDMYTHAYPHDSDDILLCCIE